MSCSPQLDLFEMNREQLSEGQLASALHHVMLCHAHENFLSDQKLVVLDSLCQTCDTSPATLHFSCVSASQGTKCTSQLVPCFVCMSNEPFRSTERNALEANMITHRMCALRRALNRQCMALLVWPDGHSRGIAWHFWFGQMVTLAVHNSVVTLYLLFIALPNI